MRTPWDDLVDDLQRYPVRPPAPVAWGAFALIVALLIGVPLALHFIARAQAQSPMRLDCADFSMQMRLAVWARDMRADENLVAIYYRTVNQQLGFNLSRAIEREVRRAWQEKLPAAKAIEMAHRRCLEQLGDLGLEG